MSDRLHPRDIVIHRTLGRAVIQAINDNEARVRVFGKRGLCRPRRVMLGDCEKEPRGMRYGRIVPKRPPLRLVK